MTKDVRFGVLVLFVLTLAMIFIKPFASFVLALLGFILDVVVVLWCIGLIVMLIGFVFDIAGRVNRGNERTWVY